MQMVESGTTLDNMAWCRRHIFVVNTDDTEGVHWFVCAFDCRVRLEFFIIFQLPPSTAPWDSKRTVGLVDFKA